MGIKKGPISNSDLIAFSDTSGNIIATNVKGALTESAVKIVTVMDRVRVSSEVFGTWVLGAIQAGGGTVDSTTRIRTDYIKVNANDLVKLSDNLNYLFSITRYTLANKSYIEQVAYRIDPYTFTEACYVKFVMKKSDDANLTSVVAATGSRLQYQQGVAFVNNRSIENDSVTADKLSPALKSNKYMHLSLDDVSGIFGDLVTNAATYTTIFSNSVLLYLKKLHDTYGTVTSLYCYVNSLSGYCANLVQYVAEFSANSSWLKFGLHGSTEYTYAESTYTVGQTDWNNFVDYVMTFTGNYNCIDRTPRLSAFAGSLDACLGMRDARCGALGFLSADDTRLSYYLDSLGNARVYPFTLESGSTDLSGTNIVEVTRIRTTEPIYLHAGATAKISTAGTHQINYVQYTSGGVFIAQSSYTTDAITVTTDGYYRFKIKTVLGTDDISGSVAAITALFSITETWNAYAYNHDKHIDYANQLTFFSTDLRMELISNITTTIAALDTAAWASKTNDLIIFTHESQMSTASTKANIEACCQYAVGKGYAFNFPMYKI